MASLPQVNIPVGTSTMCQTYVTTAVAVDKYIAACLKFAQEHLDVPQYYWETNLWTDETKVETSTSNPHPHCEAWWRSIMVWGGFVASLPGQLDFISGRMNSQGYQDVLQNSPKVEAQKTMGATTGQ